MLGKDFENGWGKVAPKSGRTKMISELIDSSVMPGIQGGPLMHVIAGKAVAFKEALDPSYKDYCNAIIANAQTLSNQLLEMGYSIVSGGTDTHLVLIDLSNKDVSGKKAEITLEKAGITTNKNMVPFDKRSPLITSGIRIGTPALTTRGMKEPEMILIAKLINDVIENIDDQEMIEKVKNTVFDLCKQYPLYGG
tara:strand:- start:1239 stop:1820 length:582 start_codon:yes stop_codon:yes gene_type:complete